MRRHLPNALTLLNLFCGALAIFHLQAPAMATEIRWPVGLIVLGAVFDLFDGMAARLLRVSSALGGELDSLADVVTFGLAPALVMTHLAATSSEVAAAGAVWRGLSLGALLVLPAFAAIRLARFNLKESGSEDFEGLPVPAMALFLCSVALLIDSPADASALAPLWGPGLLIGLAAGLSALMISPWRLLAFKFKGGFRWERHWRHAAVVIVAALAAAAFPWLGWWAGPIVFGAYLLFSWI